MPTLEKNASDKQGQFIKFLKALYIVIMQYNNYARKKNQLMDDSVDRHTILNASLQDLDKSLTEIIDELGKKDKHKHRVTLLNYIKAVFLELQKLKLSEKPYSDDELSHLETQLLTFLQNINKLLVTNKRMTISATFTPSGSSEEPLQFELSGTLKVGKIWNSYCEAGKIIKEHFFPSIGITYPKDTTIDENKFKTLISQIIAEIKQTQSNHIDDEVQAASSSSSSPESEHTENAEITENAENASDSSISHETICKILLMKDVHNELKQVISEKMKPESEEIEKPLTTTAAPEKIESEQPEPQAASSSTPHSIRRLKAEKQRPLQHDNFFSRTRSPSYPSLSLFSFAGAYPGAYPGAYKNRLSSSSDDHLNHSEEGDSSPVIYRRFG